MSHFGPRVIGKEKYQEEAAIEEVGATHFGPRVIGDILAKRRLLERTVPGEKDSRRDPSKKRVSGPEKEAALAAAADVAVDVVEAPTTTNIGELATALGANPAFYEQLYAAEFLRPAGPRKSALRLFLKHEMATEDREDRKQEITKALDA